MSKVSKVSNLSNKTRQTHQPAPSLKLETTPAESCYNAYA